MDKEKPKVSVIIPTFNRAKMVCDCVDSVLAQRDAVIEIVIVDDCSPDATGNAIRSKFGGESRVKYLRNAKNSFQAVSRNNGAKIASGDFLFFLDDDNLLKPDAIAEMLECFTRHGDAGLVAPLSIHRRPRQDNLIWTLGSDFNRWTSRPKDTFPNLPLGELPVSPEDWPTTYSPNAFMVPRHCFDKVGGFDESYVQIFEESDFGWKILELGKTAWIAAKAHTVHLGFLEPGCVSELRRLGIEKPYRTYCFARNRMRFARRHFSFMQNLTVSFVFAPLSAAYYMSVALRHKRADIALAYLRGTVAGIAGK